MTVSRTHLTLALTALAAAALYNVWYFVLRPAAPASSRPLAEQPLAGPAAPLRGDAAAPDPLSIPAPPPVDLASAPAWRRDPFLFGDESRAVVRPPVQAQAPSRPAVRTILYSAGRRLAIVDGRIVGVGDAVGGYTVADIGKDAVVFTAPSGERLRVPIHAASPGPASR
ncbi:MAG: hypothetical protein ACM3H9_08810 [Rhodospirillaceae bacterium]